MSTIPNFSEYSAYPEATSKADASALRSQVWETPEGIDVPRVFDRTDRDTTVTADQLDSFPGTPAMEGPSTTTGIFLSR